jgi:hypothetical protein
MFKNNNKSGRGTSIVYIIICILLVVVLGEILITSRKDKAEEQERLEALAVGDSVGIDDYEEIKERVEAQAEEVAEEEESEEAEAQEETSDEEEQEEADVQLASGISCWGDDLLKGTESDTYSYMNVLADLLQENGVDIPVVNKTLQGGGTLSMMKMAGVADEELQNYITLHQEGANGAQLNVTETGIRDLTAEQLDRSDADYVPVIFMGYYGGWNHDPEELAEQQEKILNTFSDPSRYIIAAAKPLNGSVDMTAFDSVMEEKWGEHYISLSSITTDAATTYNAQAALAQAVYEKLEELGYISSSVTEDQTNEPS